MEKVYYKGKEYASVEDVYKLWDKERRYGFIKRLVNYFKNIFK